MMNYMISTSSRTWCSLNGFKQPSESEGESKRIAVGGQLPKLLRLAQRPLQVNVGLLIALAAAVGICVVPQPGHDGLRAPGGRREPRRRANRRHQLEARDRARHVHLRCAVGLAGMVQVTGIDDLSTGTYGGTIGFDAIVVALLGRNTPLGVSSGRVPLRRARRRGSPDAVFSQSPPSTTALARDPGGHRLLRRDARTDRRALPAAGCRRRLDAAITSGGGRSDRRPRSPRRARSHSRRPRGRHAREPPKREQEPGARARHHRRRLRAHRDRLLRASHQQARTRRRSSSPTTPPPRSPPSPTGASRGRRDSWVRPASRRASCCWCGAGCDALACWRLVLVGTLLGVGARAAAPLQRRRRPAQDADGPGRSDASLLRRARPRRRACYLIVTLVLACSVPVFFTAMALFILSFLVWVARGSNVGNVPDLAAHGLARGDLHLGHAAHLRVAVGHRCASAQASSTSRSRASSCSVRCAAPIVSSVIGAGSAARLLRGHRVAAVRRRPPRLRARVHGAALQGEPDHRRRRHRRVLHGDGDQFMMSQVLDN